ncbi:MAG: hypothetical protein EDS66_06840 [Planctomycetota bacterium]|nr:MAG: hypothetical protein EDS66_06840 [Planctomycetota bacterium]
MEYPALSISIHQENVVLKETFLHPSPSLRNVDTRGRSAKPFQARHLSAVTRRGSTTVRTRSSGSVYQLTTQVSPSSKASGERRCHALILPDGGRERIG